MDKQCCNILEPEKQFRSNVGFTGLENLQDDRFSLIGIAFQIVEGKTVWALWQLRRYFYRETAAPSFDFI